MSPIAAVALIAAVPVQAGADYALATCLTQRATGPLRDEGFHLGAIAVAEAGRTPLATGAIRAAVARELKRRPMTTVHGDGPVAAADRPALLAHCLSIARSAPVRAVMVDLSR